MLATVDIQHPKVNNYSKQEVEAIILNLVYSYFDDEDDNDAVNDINFYRLKDEEMTDEIRQLSEELHNMTPEEFKKEYISI